MDGRHDAGVFVGSARPGDLGVVVCRVRHSVVVAFAGEMDLLTDPTAQQALRVAWSLLPEPAARPRWWGTAPRASTVTTPDPPDAAVTLLVIDLSDVTFLSARGLELLITAERAAAQRGLELRIATGAQPTVQRLLQLSGLSSLLSTFPTLDQALTGMPRDSAGSAPPR